MLKNQFQKLKKPRKHKRKTGQGSQNQENIQLTRQNFMNTLKQESEYQQITETQPTLENHTYSQFDLTQGALERIAKWEAFFTQMFAEPQAPEQSQVPEQPLQTPTWRQALERPQQEPKQPQQEPEHLLSPLRLWHYGNIRLDGKNREYKLFD